MSCLKMSCDNLRVASSICGCDAEREVKEHKRIEEKKMNRFLRPNGLSWDDRSALFRRSEIGTHLTRKVSTGRRMRYLEVLGLGRSAGPVHQDLTHSYGSRNFVLSTHSQFSQQEIAEG